MTEKRLVVDENYNLVDTVTGEWLDDTQVFDLANELHEENKKFDEWYKVLRKYGITSPDKLDQVLRNERVW